MAQCPRHSDFRFRDRLRIIGRFVNGRKDNIGVCAVVDHGQLGINHVIHQLAQIILRLSVRNVRGLQAVVAQLFELNHGG